MEKKRASGGRHARWTGLLMRSGECILHNFALHIQFTLQQQQAAAASASIYAWFSAAHVCAIVRIKCTLCNCSKMVHLTQTLAVNTVEKKTTSQKSRRVRRRWRDARSMQADAKAREITYYYSRCDGWLFLVSGTGYYIESNNYFCLSTCLSLLLCCFQSCFSISFLKNVFFFFYF